MEPVKEQESQPGVSQDTPQPAPTSAVSPEMSTMVNILASSVQGMQNSLGNAYQSMANQLKQSMEMTQTMSNMMELFLVSSLTISSRIEREEITDKPLLIITTENKSKFPIPTVSGTISIGKDNNAERIFERSTGSRVTLISSTVTVTRKASKESKDAQTTIYHQITHDITEERPDSRPLDVLGPGMKCVDVFRLDLESFDAWIILIETSFRSPGTGKKLVKKHECCIYLIDQCTPGWFADDGNREQGTAYTANMMTGPLRQILKVPVTDGVAVGMRLSLKTSQNAFAMQGYVSRISEDTWETDLVLWSENSAENSLHVLERVWLELNVLGEHPDHRRT